MNHRRSDVETANKAIGRPVPLGSSGPFPYGLLLLLSESFIFACEGCGLLGVLQFVAWCEPPSVPAECQMARRAFPVSGRGLCPCPLILAKLNVGDVGDLEFFFHSTVTYRSCNEPESASIFVVVVEWVCKWMWKGEEFCISTT